MTMTEAEKLKSTLSSIFRRKGGNGNYTRLFDDLAPYQKELLLNKVRLNCGELPIVGSAESNETWFFLTSERIVWRVEGTNVQSLPIQDVWHASADFHEMVAKGIRKHQLRELLIETVDHEQRLAQLEQGPPLFGTWNALLNLGARTRRAKRSQ